MRGPAQGGEINVSMNFGGGDGLKRGLGGWGVEGGVVGGRALASVTTRLDELREEETLGFGQEAGRDLCEEVSRLRRSGGLRPQKKR